MLDHGVHFAPSAFEAGFVSATHDDAVIASTLDIAERSSRRCERSGGRAPPALQHPRPTRCASDGGTAHGAL